MADCFRTESGELCNQVWDVGSDTASYLGPSCGWGSSITARWRKDRLDGASVAQDTSRKNGCTPENSACSPQAWTLTHQSQAACWGALPQLLLLLTQALSPHLHQIMACGLPTLLPIWVLQWPFLGIWRDMNERSSHSSCRILNSDSNQNNIGILPKQVFSNQILTGSVTDLLQLERQRAWLHSQPVRPVLSLWLEHYVKQSHCFQALSCYWRTAVLSGQVIKRTQVWGLRPSHLERLKIWIIFLVILRTEFVWAIKSITESVHSIIFCEMDGLVCTVWTDTSEFLSLASHIQQCRTPCYKLMDGFFSSLY